MGAVSSVSNVVPQGSSNDSLTERAAVVRGGVFAILDELDKTPNNIKLIKNVEKAFNNKQPNETEVAILQDVLDLVNLVPSGKGTPAELLADILSGAHIRIIDNGEFYNKWSLMHGAEERISSHPSKEDSKQYGVNGPWVHEILFGVVPDEQARDMTFFQLENSSWGRGFGDSVVHILDYLKYKASGKNQGPYGASEHTDRNAVVIDIVKEADGWVVHRNE